MKKIGSYLNNVRRFILLSLMVTVLLPMTRPAEAQDGLPEDADPANGVQIYADRCASCHGTSGLGDGELAEQAVNPPPPIGSPEYLTTADPAVMFAIVNNGNIQRGMPGFGEGNNSTPLSREDIWDVISAVYQIEAFSQPIPNVTVTGQVINGTTQSAVANTSVTLQAFTRTFEQSLLLEAVTDANGQYVFDLQRIPPNWLYRVVAVNGDLEFSSDIASITPIEPAADLPIVIYEATSEPSGVRITHLDFLIEFVEDRVQVAELYTISQQDPAVYVGRSGDFRLGSLEITLPQAAEGVILLRGVGGPTDFIPIEGTIQNGQTLLPPLPISPGNNSMRLLLRYSLPYDGQSLQIERLFAYPAESISAALPESGVTLSGPSGWQTAAELTPEAENETAVMRLRYNHPAILSNDTISLNLAGFPRYILDSNGNRVAVRNSNQELWIGIISLALTVLVVSYQAYRWRKMPPQLNQRDQLVERLAALDLAYEEGSIRKRAYERRRQILKDQLMIYWD